MSPDGGIVHQRVKEMDSRAGLSRPAPKPGKPLSPPQVASLTGARAQAGPAEPAAAPPTNEPTSRQGSQKRPRPETDSDGESGPSHSRLTHFKVPAKPEGFDNAYQLVRALEMHRKLRLSIRVARDQGMIIVPKDHATLKFLREIRELKDGRKVSLSPLTPEDKRSKMVLLGFPVSYDVELITSHPQVVEASRMTVGKTPTRQVLVTLKGAPTTTLDLGNWGTFKLRTFVPEPLRCFKCQKYGHHQANCTAKPKCGVCSKAHNTEVCLTAHREKKETTAKCPNCAKRHHAWSLTCSVRKQAALKRQEVAEKRPDFIPAPPGTYVWGRKKSEKAPQPPKRKEAAPQPTPEVSNTTEFPEMPKPKKKPKKKASKKASKPSSGDDDLFDEADMTLLVTAVVTAVATALGRTREEAEKAVTVAMTAMTKTVAILKGRKQDRAQPAPAVQDETPLPAPSQAQQAESAEAEAEAECAEPAPARPAKRSADRSERKAKASKVRSTQGSPPPSGPKVNLTSDEETEEDFAMVGRACDRVSDVTID